MREQLKREWVEAKAIVDIYSMLNVAGRTPIELLEAQEKFRAIEKKIERFVKGEVL